MKIPKVRHEIIKPLGQGLYLCTDQRATSSPKLEGSSGGAGYEYYGYENKILEYRKREARRSRYIKKKSAEQSTAQAVQAPIGTGQ